MLQMYPGGYHQLYNEPDGQGDEVMSDVAKWIEDMLPS